MPTCEQCNVKEAARMIWWFGSPFAAEFICSDCETELRKFARWLRIMLPTHPERGYEIQPLERR